MLGAIVGDVIGSVHEWAGTKTIDFPLFVPEPTYTDDTVLTVAVADWIMSGGGLTDVLQGYTHAYPGRFTAASPKTWHGAPWRSSMAVWPGQSGNFGRGMG